MQMSGWKVEKALTSPKPQGHILYIGLVKAYGPVSREKLFFSLCKIKQRVRLVGDMKNASKNVYFSHFV